jgi:uncharacterized protein YndB with AHSA1/START domain
MKKTPVATAPVSDQAVTRATGRGWAEWCRLLDADGAASMPHADIARLVHTKYDGGSWWSQMIAVGYERLRGLRVLNQKCSGDFEVSRSRTIDAPIARVYRAWQSAAARRRWLADPAIAVRAARANKSLRFGWVDGKTRGEARFVDKGERTAVTVQHIRLADARAAEKMKKYWGAQLDALAAHIASVRS